MVRVLQVYDTIAVSSGITNVIMSWMRNVDSTQISMDVLACWKKKPDYSEEIMNMGNRVFYIGDEDHITNYSLFIKKIYKFFSNHAKEYDVVHLHSSIFTYPIIYAAKKYGINKCIIHVHSTALGNTRISTLRNLITLIPMKLSKSQYWACSKEAANAWYEKVGIHRYSIINNGIDVNSFYRNEAVREKHRKEWGVDEKTFLLGHISNMSPVKNVPFLIEVAASLIQKGYRIKTVLIGRDQLPEEVRSLIKERNIEDSIINVGVRDDISCCVQALDVCLMPSLAEGYGLVPIEAQVARVPVILSEGFPSIITELPLSFPLELSIEEWENLCERLINNVEDVEIKYNALLYNKFDIKQITSEVVDKYKHLIGVKDI